MREGTVNTQIQLKIGTKTDLSSRYYYQSTVIDTSHETLYGIAPDMPGFEAQTEITYHTVTASETDRLDKVAFYEYGKASLWWLIAWANKIIDPFILVKGTTLIIPLLDDYRRAVQGG